MKISEKIPFYFYYTKKNRQEIKRLKNESSKQP